MGGLILPLICYFRFISAAGSNCSHTGSFLFNNGSCRHKAIKTMEENTELKPEAAQPEAEGVKSEVPAPEPEVDFKAELEKAKTEREHYKQGMLNAKAKLKEQNLPEVDISSLVEQKVNEQLDERFSVFETDFASDTVETLLDGLTANADERELIKFHYENTVRHSGVTKSAILTDLRRARLHANEAKILLENEELRVALKSKNSITNSGMGSGQSKSQPDNEPNFTPQELAILKRRNIDPKKVKL